MKRTDFAAMTGTARGERQDYGKVMEQELHERVQKDETYTSSAYAIMQQHQYDTVISTKLRGPVRTYNKTDL